MLTFQHNQIAKIENLISLPNLIYIDFFDNQIKEIENLSNGIPTLKVLLLPKNSISKIKKQELIPSLLEMLVKIQEEEKTLDSYNKIYLNFLKNNNNRIKSTFFSTKNGRIASKEENIQGFPKNKFREILSHKTTMF